MPSTPTLHTIVNTTPALWNLQYKYPRAFLHKTKRLSSTWQNALAYCNASAVVVNAAVVGFAAGYNPLIVIGYASAVNTDRQFDVSAIYHSTISHFSKVWNMKADSIAFGNLKFGQITRHISGFWKMAELALLEKWPPRWRESKTDHRNLTSCTRRSMFEKGRIFFSWYRPYFV
jgi:hypothetical protein